MAEVSVPTVTKVQEMIDASGGGGGVYVETELDFGAVGTDLLESVITDAGMTAGKRIIVTQSMNTPTGKDQDEATMDDLIFRALPAAGSFTLQAQSITGPISGTLKVFYTYG